ncbi:MAG: leucine-rich repeat domain-containing protein, partial [Candidatus Thorarchaeota archaeon]
FGNNLTALDLNPLGSCKSLEILRLSWNELKQIDFTEIKSTTNLKVLDLYNNKIKNIDLSPLSSLLYLNELRLNENQIRSIDLEPLRILDSLQELDLSWNQLQEIDLSPLKHCSDLRSLGLHGNQLTDIDLGPLGSCQKLERLCLYRNRFSQIDLRPLSHCPGLLELHLSWNQLESIDLTPVGACKNLEELHLDENHLAEIDLKPLASCHNLQALHLNGNQLRSVDLKALASGACLRELGLSHNALQIIDLSPLSSCTTIEKLELNDNRLERINLDSLGERSVHGKIDLYNNKLKTIDLSPLISLEYWADVGIDLPVIVTVDPIFSGEDLNLKLFPDRDWNIQWQDYHHKMEREGWDAMKRTAIEYLNRLSGRHRLAGQSSFLEALGITEFNGFDGDLVSIIESIDGITSYDQLVDEIYEILVECLRIQVAARGNTVLLDIERMRDGMAAVLISDIAKRRREEILETTVQISDGVVDLEPLLLTAYGFEILTKMKMPLRIATWNLEKVQKELSYIDLCFKTTSDRIINYPVTTSEDMKQYLKRVYAEFLKQTPRRAKGVSE